MQPSKLTVHMDDDTVTCPNARCKLIVTWQYLSVDHSEYGQPIDSLGWYYDMHHGNATNSTLSLSRTSSNGLKKRRWSLLVGGGWFTNPLETYERQNGGWKVEIQKLWNHHLDWCCWWFRNPAPVEGGSLFHYLQGFSTIPGGCLRFLKTSTLQTFTAAVDENTLLSTWDSQIGGTENFPTFGLQSIVEVLPGRSLLWAPWVGWFLGESPKDSTIVWMVFFFFIFREKDYQVGGSNFQPIWKIWTSNGITSPRMRGENTNIWVATTQLLF